MGGINRESGELHQTGELMSVQTGKKIINEIKFSPRRIIPRFGAALVILALMCSALLVTGVRATTLLNPEPEDSTTLFGYAIADIGDVNNDGVTDLAVGTPYQ